jgi:hypothetical protein
MEFKSRNKCRIKEQEKWKGQSSLTFFGMTCNRDALNDPEESEK